MSGLVETGKVLLIWVACMIVVLGLGKGVWWLADQDWFADWGKWIGFGGWTLLVAVMIWIWLKANE